MTRQQMRLLARQEAKAQASALKDLYEGRKAHAHDTISRANASWRAVIEDITGRTLSTLEVRESRWIRMCKEERLFRKALRKSGLAGSYSL